MTTLTKTRTVLRRTTAFATGPATFQQPDADGRSHFVVVDSDVWHEMGCPDVITVTIEPGDQLNEE